MTGPGKYQFNKPGVENKIMKRNLFMAVEAEVHRVFVDTLYINT